MTALNLDLQLFKHAFNATQTGLVMVSAQGEILHCNPAFSALVDGEAETLTGSSFYQLCAEEEHFVFRDYLEQLAATPEAPFSLEMRLLSAQRGANWVYVCATQVEDTEDELTILLSIQDASNYHEVQDSLEENLKQIRRSEKTLSDVLDAIPQALFVVNNRGIILLCNKGAELLFDASMGRLLGDNLAVLVPARTDNIKSFLADSATSRHGKQYAPYQTCTQARRSDSDFFPVSLQLRPLGWGNLGESLCIVEDLSEREELERRIDEATYFDTLTGLPNRQYLHKQMALFVNNTCPTNRHFALFFCDLDRFKYLNDSFGHAASDTILIEIGQRILSATFPNDLSCRYSGDKFIIVPEQCIPAETAARIAQRVLDAIAAPLSLNGQELFLTASIGIAVSPDDGTSLDGLVKNAESAMYRVKGKGGNGYSFYTRKLNAHSMDRLKLVNALHRALERKEFSLSFQPQVNPHSFKIEGAEALLRWNYPNRGILLPNDFVPLLEETGLIVPVGEWVLRMACLQAIRWRELIDSDFRMAVNISARQLRDRKFVTRVAKILAETGLSAEGLELEITESALLEDMQASGEILRQLSDLGVLISIDDFGTGYSSFTYLKYFSAHALKLDRLFVEGLPYNQEDISISRAICALANSLNMNLIAEGVENVEQLDMLRQWHCTQVQGFYFTQPLPAGRFEHWLSAYGRDKHDKVFDIYPEPA